MAGHVTDRLAVRHQGDALMRVEVYPADSGACGFYRLRLPASQLGAAVVDDGLRLGVADGRVVDATADADVVVLQRPANALIVAAIPHLQRHGVAVVVDMDDDFAALDPKNPTWTADRKAHRLILEACRRADLVTVTTPGLARRYGGHGRVQILPNVVPARYLTVTAERDGRTAGWAGSVSTHPNDLQVTGGAVAQAVRETGGRFQVIGDGNAVREHLRLDVEPDVTGIVPLTDYPRHVAGLDVGIVPLTDSTFNRSKSALKLLEYSALGVASVVSPTPDNLRVGIGLVAHRPRDWSRLVRRLLTQVGYRAEVAERARAAVAERHTIEGNAWRWEQAWSRALATRRASSLLPA